jgi:hypothetical protein
VVDDTFDQSAVSTEITHRYPACDKTTSRGWLHRRINEPRVFQTHGVMQMIFSGGSQTAAVIK